VSEVILTSDPTRSRNKLIRQARLLAFLTIFYNLLEGLVSVYFGLQDETLSLFGFGIDSFVEVLSGLGIWRMLYRMSHSADANSDSFERQALRVTGFSFYLLAAGLFVTSLLNLIAGHKPDSTFAGIVIGLISIFTMQALIYYKQKVGAALQSPAILADANCTKTCLYLSIVLIFASFFYEITAFGGVDALGALFIAWFSYREGREAFTRSRGESCGCDVYGKQ
jgi:divalent metal cation (Fe/Co/Zn/Cd) transporter